MKHLSNAHKLKKQITVEVIKEFLSDKLEENLKYIPVNLRPRIKSSSRCCVYKDRELIKYRVMAALGVATEDEIEEATTLGEYGKVALERKSANKRILSVLNIACQSCVKARYLVTEACKGCLARPCTTVCPQQTIYVKDGQAYIDYAKCNNCGKCVDACPYSAIIHIPVPCEKECSVGAIKKNAYNQQYIDFDKCIYCGKCTNACPFGAVLEISQVIDVLKAIKGEKKVNALISPAIEGQFPGTLEQFVTAIKEIGFDEVYEVASGGLKLIKNESEVLEQKLRCKSESSQNNNCLMTSSSCPAYLELVKKYIPEMAQYVSQSKSPLQYTADKLSSENSDAVNVFIGSCMANKLEVQNSDNLDFCLTFEDLGAMLIAHKIDIQSLSETSLSPSKHNNEAKTIAKAGGLAAAVEKAFFENNTDKIDVHHIDGVTIDKIAELKLYANKEKITNYLEVTTCEGGCQNGPCSIGLMKLKSS
ncbi:[Fe-Fe] hydrogenase large subunit C-terminal domain-containing protein [Lentisphaerota bacterium WC36G]|nr:4Fe-4S binding protein [Lentisphaerae bacterium WC36]